MHKNIFCTKYFTKYIVFSRLLSIYVETYFLQVILQYISNHNSYIFAHILIVLFNLTFFFIIFIYINNVKVKHIFTKMTKKKDVSMIFSYYNNNKRIKL